MKVTFLQAAVKLTKTFYIKDDQLQKIGHPRVINYTSHEEEFETIEEFYELLKRHANLGHCLLKGNLKRPLADEPRAGTTDSNFPTRLFLADLDGLKGCTINELLTQLKLHEVDYVIQYSASQGIVPDRGESAHIFFILDKETTPAFLKQWLIKANLDIPALKNGLHLTRTNNALCWSLDITTCQNDKLIYIAPPILQKGVEDGFKGKRIQLVKRKYRTMSLGDKVPSAEANRVAMEAILNELRTTAGLPKRPKTTFKTAHSTEYLSKPDIAMVTGIKKDRGFVYLNINGGDSWGYYHPENNPTFILNFKNEPVYKTSELLPDYWADVRSKVGETAISKDGKIYLAFRDFHTAKYFNGTYDPKSQELDLAEARGEKQIRDFLMQHQLPVGDFIPDWKMYFDPQDGVIVDLDNKRINKFRPSKYMKLKHRDVHEVPPGVKKIAMHAVGGDEQFFEYLMNWSACIVQYHCKTGCGLVMQGTQGTGKSTFLGKILAPILGQKYAFAKRMDELESQFNGWMEDCLLVWIDEAQVSSYKRADVLSANLKTYITDSPLSIRAMYREAFMAPNYTNFVFPSNKQAVEVDQGDRRFSIAFCQETPLVMTDKEYNDAIGPEVEEFYHYLMTRSADREIARKPLQNAARDEMMRVSQKAIDGACDALLRGDYEFFASERPTEAGIAAMVAFKRDAAHAYNALLDKIKKEKPPTISREEMLVLLDYLVGDMPTSPYKFSAYLKHHKVHIQPIRHEGKPARGIRIEWKLGKE